MICTKPFQDRSVHAFSVLVLRTPPWIHLPYLILIYHTHTALTNVFTANTVCRRIRTKTHIIDVENLSAELDHGTDSLLKHSIKSVTVQVTLMARTDWVS